MLCLDYVKGRDWYDFIWYIARRTSINFALLQQSIAQAGHWKEQNITITTDWFSNNLKSKIKQIDWQEAKKDIARFLRPREAASLDVWLTGFFLSRVEKMADYLG